MSDFKVGGEDRVDNLNKDMLDKESMLKDIAERENIIYNYQIYGILDRDDAIQKIQELRKCDQDVAIATSINLAISSVPFS